MGGGGGGGGGGGRGGGGGGYRGSEDARGSAGGSASPLGVIIVFISSEKCTLHAYSRSRTEMRFKLQEMPSESI